MNNKDLLLLEEEAGEALRGSMQGFDDGTYFACPWLRYYISKYPNKQPEIVIVLQDWGNKQEGLESAIGSVDPCGRTDGRDKTMQNLFLCAEVKTGIISGTHCVMNAVWGVRGETKPKSGYLGAAIHKKAWKIWGKAVSMLNPSSKLITCGSWSTFGVPDESANDYLDRWASWAKSGKVLLSKDVKYDYWAHPAAWGWLDDAPHR